MTNLLLQFVFFILSVLFVILLISLGWYLVWKLFLCRFSLVRELFMIYDSKIDKPRTKKTKAVKID